MRKRKKKEGPEGGLLMAPTSDPRWATPGEVRGIGTKAAGRGSGST